MRANGVPERFITGSASDYEKFLAYARTVPATFATRSIIGLTWSCGATSELRNF